MSAESPILCTRRIEFDAGHRIVGHEHLCKYLHGHRYVIEASFMAPKLDKLGRVIDFSEIYRRLGEWINQHFDHTTILYKEDQALGKQLEAATGQRIYYLQQNPTAENIAYHLFYDIIPELFRSLDGIKCVAIKLYETPNNYVEIRY